jgi:cytochrome c oxidase subunit IV
MEHSAMTEIPLSSDQHHGDENKRYHHFFNLAIVLSFVTMIELVLIFLPFVKGFLFWTLVVLSLAKFVAVILVFMHLVYDKLIYTLLFLAGLTLASGTVVALSYLFSPAHVDVEALSHHPGNLIMAEGETGPMIT